MKEYPILFSGSMVRAIIAGDKTQTRRVVKPQAPEDFPHALCDRFGVCAWGETGSEQDDWWPDGTMRCPYGTLGDRLWVRETWSDFFQGPVLYRADSELTPASSDDFRWRPSIFMLRKDCRVVLEISAIRVERLNAISEEDAIAEGLDPVEVDLGVVSAREQYEGLWDSLNVKRGYGWSKNPWVWVIEFRRVQK